MDFKKNGNMLIIVAVILWSITGIIIKTVEAGPIWINLVRSLSGGIFLSPFIFREKIYPIRSVVITSILMAIFLLSVTVTTLISSSAMAMAMQTAAPMYIIGYGFYKNKKVDRKKAIVLILIFIGVFLNILSCLNSVNNLAILFGLAIGISFILYSYNLQKVKSGSPLGIIGLINLICSFFYLVLIPFNYANPPSSLKDLILLCLAGVLVSGLSYAFYGAGLRKVSIENAVIIGLMEPILNPIWVYLGTGEIPEFITILGLIFILFGAGINVFVKENKEVNVEQKIGC